MNSRFSLTIRWTLVILGVCLVFQIVSGIYAIVAGGSITDLVWLFASDLNQDQEHRTNFLLLGEGGIGHDGGDLTDTVLVVSYNHEFNTLSMLSIPRDFWVETSNKTGMRINRAYEYEKQLLNDSETALENTSKIVSKITNLPIHYFAKIDFSVFTDIIDAFGGVKVLVENKINDPYFPCPNMLNYCPFSISTGVHEMDGETALKFVRSRKTTSDFDRAARQQKIIEAIREKAFAEDILTSPKKLKRIYKIFENRVETNLRFREILRLGKIADEFNKQNIAQIVLSDEPTFTGGLLYPPSREDYGGAAVFLPDGNNFRKIHLLSDILFGHPRVIIDQLAIEVLNGSGKSRIAQRVAYDLNRYGLNTARINNFPKGLLEHTVVYFYNEEITRKTLDVLKKFTDAPQEKGPLDLQKRGFDITIVLGKDWQEIF